MRRAPPCCRRARLDRATMGAMLDIDAFVAECLEAKADGMPAIRELVERTIAAPGEVEPVTAEHQGVTLLHRSPELTVLSVVIPPGRDRSLPHDHRMPAVVGVYRGREDNHFYRRDHDTLADSGGRSLTPGDTIAMGTETIHAIQNPSSHERLGALHVYAGDLLGAEQRSMWTMPDWHEAPYDQVQVLGAEIA